MLIKHFLIFRVTHCLALQREDFNSNDWCAGHKMDMVSTGIISIRKEEETGTLLVSHVTVPHYTPTSQNLRLSQVFITLGFREKSI